MAAQTSIEWTDRTWNPVVGCAIHSPGCKHCYAMPMAHRLEAMGVEHYQGLTRKVNGHVVWTGVMRPAPERVLLQPLTWRKRARVFVNSMSDLFADGVERELIDRVWAIMALTPHLTYQVLTKRSERMREYLNAPGRLNEIELAAERLKASVGLSVSPKWCFRWPLPNVWGGVSIERQDEARRAWDLVNTPLAVRIISAEPLIGPLDLTAIDVDGDSQADVLSPRTWGQEIDEGWRETSDTWEEDFLDHFSLCDMPRPDELMHPVVDQVIVGGESGADARPMHPDWAREIRDACAKARTAFFFKQCGGFAVSLAYGGVFQPDQVGKLLPGRDGAWWAIPAAMRPNADGSLIGRFEILSPARKAEAGRLLDGIEHNAMPEAR